MTFVLPLQWGRLVRSATAVLFAAIIATTLVAASWREATLGGAEVMAGDEALARGMWEAAIAHYRAAAESPAIGSNSDQLAMARLAALGQEAAARGDRASSILAYGALRTAALATQGSWISNERWRSIAEDGLARLAVSDLDTTSRPEQVLAAVRSDLSVRAIPPRGKLTALWTSALVALVGLAWLATAPTGSDLRLAKVSAFVGFAVYTGVSLLS